MSDNGHTKQITVDLNRVTRREFRQFRDRLSKIKEDDIDAREEIVSGFYAQVIVEWPYDVEITPDNYLSLGLIDANAVDQAVQSAITAMTEKN